MNEPSAKALICHLKFYHPSEALPEVTKHGLSERLLLISTDYANLAGGCTAQPAIVFTGRFVGGLLNEFHIDGSPSRWLIEGWAYLPSREDLKQLLSKPVVTSKKNSKDLNRET